MNGTRKKLNIDEIRSLLSEFEIWSENLDKISRLHSINKHELQINIEKVHKKCSELLEHDSLAESVSNIDMLSFHSLYESVIKCFASAEAEKKSKIIKENNYSETFELFKALDKKCSNKFSLFVNSLFRKKECENEFDKLNKFIQTDDFNCINAQADCLTNYLSIPNNDIVHLLSKSANVYYNFLLSQFSLPKSEFIINVEIQCPYISKYCENWKNIFDAQISNWKEILQDNIEKACTLDINMQLNKIPLTDINKGNTSYHGIKAMEKAGIKTFGDVYKTSLFSLGQIKGVSLEAAQKIKDKVSQLASLLQDKKIPLSLNYDTRNQTTDEIVRKLYYCKRYLQNKKEYESLASANYSKDSLKDDISIIKELNNDIFWLFAPYEFREKYVYAYTAIIKTVQFLDENNYPYYWEQEKLLQSCNWGQISAENAWDDFRIHASEYITCIEFLFSGLIEDIDNNYGLPEELANAIEQTKIFPNGLTCELRYYQVWGVKYILHQERALLGDEMGLGKTIQAIAVMVSLKNLGFNHFVVVCPASVLLNWYREIYKHSKLDAYQAHGNLKNVAIQEWWQSGGVLITTYDTLGTLKLGNVEKAGLLVVDEAHYIKNKNAKRTKIVKQYCEQIKRVVFLTGTPIENNVDEMLSLLSILQPDTAEKAAKYKLISLSEKFRDIIAPVYFRRKQADVNKELPERIENIIWCQMSEEENQLYENIMLNNKNPFMTARRVSWSLDDMKFSSKAQRLKEIIAEAKENNRKVLIFSFFLEVLQKVFQMCEEDSCIPITGSLNSESRQNIIDDFSNNPDRWILPAQIQAGGTGLNIQAASVVILCEPQIKPSIEDQAIARAHRMGQSRNVLVYRLCCENTIDEKILNLLEKKRAQFNAFADKSTAGAETLTLSNTDISNIIKEEINRIKEKKGMQSPSSNFIEYTTKETSEEPRFTAENNRLSESEILQTTASTYEISPNCDYKKLFGWYFFCTDYRKAINISNSGKWMYFFNKQELGIQICRKAISEKACDVCKCTDLSTTDSASGVVCFYLDAEDIKSHKKVLNFMLNNGLIGKTKEGRYKNISFKLDKQTRNQEYGNTFVAEIKLSDFMNLYTGEWIV